MKRLTLLFLLCVATIPSWAHDFVMDGIYYNIISSSNLMVEVTYRGNSPSNYSNECSGSVTIPSSVAYNGKTYSVTRIVSYAFSGCSSLTSITIPESVTGIGDGTFKGCSSLTSITIPESVTSIGDYAFSGCSSLTSITIPESVTSIGDYAFSGCSSLTSITIPESMTSIGDYAFSRCSSLTSITIPESVTNIGDYAFSGCSSLTLIIVEENNPVYDSRDNCNAIINTTNNELVIGCSSTIIPQSVTSIGYGAFHNCSSLTSITIPESVTDIGGGMFEGCSSLTSITVEENNPVYDSRDNCNAIIRTSSNELIAGCTSTIIPKNVTHIGNSAFRSHKFSSLTIPESVTNIGSFAFYDCTGTLIINCNIPSGSFHEGAFFNSKFSTVTVSEGVTSIGDYAFYDCNSLTSITIPESVTSIGGNAFSGCSSLTSITIPESVTSIGWYAFYDCSNLTSINIPTSVTNIEDQAFSKCSSLTSITVEGNNPVYDSRDNCNAIINTANNELVIGCSSTIIPKSVTSIGYHAFYGCSSLTSITIPESVTNIEYNVFSGCTDLVSIVVEENNPIYDSRDNCNAIINTANNELVIGCSSTIIPLSVTSIGYDAFSGCTGLKKLVIPKNIKSIGSDAFRDCLFQSLLLYCRNLSSYNDYSLNSKSTIYAYKTEIPLIQKRNSCNYVALDEPYTIKDCKSYIHGVDFNLAGNSLFENNVELLSIEVGEQSIAINDSNKYEVYGLDENTQYDIKVTCKVNDSIYNITEQITTKEISVTPYIAEITNTTISVSVTASKDKTCSTNDRGFLFNGKDYNYSGETILISNLTPNESYTISPYAYYGAKKVVGADKTVSTYGLEPKMSTLKLTPTTYQAYGHYKIIDACISETGFTNHTEGDVLTLTGLDPSTKYTIEYYVKTKEGSNEKVTTTFTTPALEMTTLNPKVVSNSCAIVAATTNMSDEETNAGFQWRKYEAPETLPSSEGYAAIYDGQLEGYIKNLQATSFYNVRAFYKSTAGKYYYTDWVTFDPSDFSYFEPTVHTYPTEELTANSAKVKGYVLQGTDAITEQGFVYWPTGTNKANTTRNVTVPENASIVIAKGQVMNATLEGLTPSTTYNFCAFVTTASGTIYGEEHSFTTKADETGIEMMESEQPAPSIIGYYDLNGRKLSEPQHGITIVRYSDGTARKILTK